MWLEITRPFNWRFAAQKAASLWNTTSHTSTSEVPRVFITRRYSRQDSTSQPTELLQDNQAALKLSRNAIQHARTKHFRARQALIRHLVIDEIIRPEYAPTDEMPADIYTKALHAPKFTYWRKYNQGE